MLKIAVVDFVCAHILGAVTWTFRPTATFLEPSPRAYPSCRTSREYYGHMACQCVQSTRRWEEMFSVSTHDRGRRVLGARGPLHAMGSIELCSGCGVTVAAADPFRVGQPSWPGQQHVDHQRVSHFPRCFDQVDVRACCVLAVAVIGNLKIMALCASLASHI